MIPTTFSCKICIKSEINEFTKTRYYHKWCRFVIVVVVVVFIIVDFLICLVVVASKRSFEFKASIQSDITNKIKICTYIVVSLYLSRLPLNCHTINSPKSDSERKKTTDEHTKDCRSFTLIKSHNPNCASAKDLFPFFLCFFRQRRRMQFFIELIH